jgi:hypothetical protein
MQLKSRAFLASNTLSDSKQSNGEGIVKVNWLEPPGDDPWPPAMHNPFRCFNSSPEVIRLTVMMYIRYPPSLRQVEGLCHVIGVQSRRM